jgi:hypothetical protein
VSVCANDENACEKCKPLYEEAAAARPWALDPFKAGQAEELRLAAEEAIESDEEEIEPGSEKDLYPDGTKWRVVPNRRDRRRLGFRNPPRQFRTTSPRRNPVILGNVRRSKFIKEWMKLYGDDE